MREWIEDHKQSIVVGLAILVVAFLVARGVGSWFDAVQQRITDRLSQAAKP